MFVFRCLEPSSPGFAEKSSFVAFPTTPLQSRGDQGPRGQKRVFEDRAGEEEQEEACGCWLPDMAQFMQKIIKVDGVGVKRLRDLTMEDFLRFVQMSTDTLPYHSGRQVSEILYKLKSDQTLSLKQGERLELTQKYFPLVTFLVLLKTNFKNVMSTLCFLLFFCQQLRDHVSYCLFVIITDIPTSF